MHQAISFSDETYNPDSFLTQILIISTFPNGIIWTIIDTVRKKFVALEYAPIPYDYANEQFVSTSIQLIKSKFINEYSFKQVIYIAYTNKSIFVPENLFIEDKEKCLSTFVFGNNLNIINSFAPKYSKIRNIFCLPDNLQNIASLFNNSVILSTSIPLAWSCFNQTKNNISFNVSFYNNSHELIVMKNDSLLIYNINTTNNHNDDAYFILNTYKSLNIDNTKIPLNVSGLINKNDEKYQVLNSFFNKIIFNKAQTDYLFSYRFNEIPRHWFSLIFDSYYAYNKW